MDMITGMDYRNGHYAIALGALNVFVIVIVDVLLLHVLWMR